MRKVIKILAILFVLLIVAVIAMPFLIPVDTYKQQIVSRVKDATGRDLVIEGDMQATLFPTLGVELEKVSLSNPDGYSSGEMIRADRLVLAVDLGALLQKQLQVKRFVLENPVINLETDAAGRPNWQFAAPVGKTPAIDGRSASAQEGKSGSFISGIMLGDVTISNGQINYHNMQNKQSVTLSDVDVRATLPSLSQPFNAKGSALWNDEKLEIELTLANPDKLIRGDVSEAALDVKAEPLVLHYDGKVAQRTAAGQLSLAVPSLPALVNWMGGGFQWKGETPLRVAAKGGLECSASSCSLNNSDISLDEIKARGSVKAVLSQQPPAIEADLTTDSLNLTPYIAKPQASSSDWFIRPAMAIEWSNEPIDLSALRTANAKLNLTTASLTYGKVTLGRTVIRSQLNNSLLTLLVPEAVTYGGMAKVSSTLNANGTLNTNVTLMNVEAEPFLIALADNDRISGKLTLSADLAGQLTSVRDLIHSLGGGGSLQFRDGAVKGIDLAGMIRNVQSAFKEVDTSQKKTDFSELSGTYAITKGVISNNDLMLKAPLLRVTGQGTVNLPLNSIYYRLTPMIVQTIQGQGGKDKQGLEIPVIVTGTLEKPVFTPDVAGIAQKAIENPEAIKESIQPFKEQLRQGKQGIKELKGLLEGLKPPKQ